MKNWILDTANKRRDVSTLCRFLILFFSLALFFSPLSAQEPGSGELRFSNANIANNQPQQAILLESHVEATLTGLVAQVEYRQVFQNQTRDWQEAQYAFPLPENAAVQYMEILVGERRIVASIKEKEEARQIYETAKSEGKIAALTEQQRANFFTQEVANIPPLSQVEIRISYSQAIEYKLGKFSFALPTTFTPRFILGIPLSDLEANADERYTTSTNGWGSLFNHAPTDMVPDADKITPYMAYAEDMATITGLRQILTPNPISINIKLEAGLNLSRLESRYHDIDIQRTDQSYQIQFAQGSVSMDRDFVLEWQPIATQAPQVALFEEQRGEHRYHLAMIMPPQVLHNGATLPREITLVIDTSGSMQGISIQAAKNSLQMAVNRMAMTDHFNIIEFNTNFTSLFASPQPASAENIRRANSFIDSLRATGGTNMIPALDKALSAPATDGLLKQVIFLTDGAIGNEQGLLTLLNNKLGKSRLFTVGIGSAPNSYLMTQMAQFGRGTHTYVRNLSDVQRSMSELFQKLESPVMADLQLSWPMEVEQFPSITPDLYAGEPLVVVAKSSPNTTSAGQLSLSGTTQSLPWTRSLSIDPDAPANQEGIATLWARSKIEELMGGITRGVPEPEVKSQVLPLALEHQLVSKYTSLVAVEEYSSRSEAENLYGSPLANLFPAGQTAWPSTATPMQVFFALALFSLAVFFTLLIFNWRKYHLEKIPLLTELTELTQLTEIEEQRKRTDKP